MGGLRQGTTRASPRETRQDGQKLVLGAGALAGGLRPGASRANPRHKVVAGGSARVGVLLQARASVRSVLGLALTGVGWAHREVVRGPADLVTRASATPASAPGAAASVPRQVRTRFKFCVFLSFFDGAFSEPERILAGFLGSPCGVRTSSNTVGAAKYLSFMTWSRLAVSASLRCLGGVANGAMSDEHSRIADEQCCTSICQSCSA